MPPRGRKTFSDDLLNSIDDNPSDRDMAEFGYGSPYDDDPLTIGYTGNNSRRFWTRGRIILLVVSLILVLSFLLADLAPLMQ